MPAESLRREIALRIAGDIVFSDNPGEAMRRWRERFGVTQSQLAKHMGVSPSVISDYESGRRRSPGIHLIRRYVEALLEIDEESGSRVTLTLARIYATPGKMWEAVIDMRELPEPVTIERFCELAGAELLTCKEARRVPILGYTIVDSLKLLLEVPAYEYMRLYGATTQRAAIFTRVSRGRSPVVAIKAMQAVTGGLRPALLVLHGRELREVDKMATIVAEREGIPLAVVRGITVEELVRRLREAL